MSHSIIIMTELFSQHYTIVFRNKSQVLKGTCSLFLPYTQTASHKHSSFGEASLSHKSWLYVKWSCYYYFIIIRKPGVLQSMGSQRIGLNRVTKWQQIITFRGRFKNWLHLVLKEAKLNFSRLILLKNYDKQNFALDYLSRSCSQV